MTLLEHFVICAPTQAENTNGTHNGGYFSVYTRHLVLPIHEHNTFDADPIMYIICFFPSLHALTACPRFNKMLASKHKSFIHRNKHCKDDCMTYQQKGRIDRYTCNTGSRIPYHSRARLIIEGIYISYFHEMEVCIPCPDSLHMHVIIYPGNIIHTLSGSVKTY